MIIPKVDQYSPSYNHLIPHILASDNHVLINAKAGSGKSSFIRSLHSQLDRLKTVQHLLLAPTNLAAYEIQGSTIHAAFEIKHTAFTNLSTNPPLSEQAALVFSKVDILIIDEISMVSAELLNHMDAVLKTVRNNPTPFGGIRLILIGDIYQLPPVDENDGYFFVSDLFADADTAAHIEYYSFEHSFRHQNDPAFASLLDTMRMNALTATDFQILNARCLHNIKPTPDKPIYPTLCSTNEEANGTNILAIHSMGMEVISVEPEITIFPDSEGVSLLDSPLAASMKIGVGCPVIFMLNNIIPSYIKGHRGIIKNITMKHGILETVAIEKKNGETINIERKDSYILKPYFDENLKTMRTKPVAQITNFPFIPSFGLTVHKAQGLTLNQATINKGTGFFTSGQCYVACSRVTSLKNLYLLQEITRADIKADPAIIEFMTAIKSRIKAVYPE